MIFFIQVLTEEKKGKRMWPSHMTLFIILISIVPDESGSLTGKNMISE
jgi:hypothetical protein